ncbi:hypothetical protein CY35_18G030200 [Sphagnum magellanicum]|nr:hypothetical protein CY35_18G030200 [Sphagnum magellanicum]KAH9533051.1 hypothetical protein CY35_18G030200 [Sphagnum magellanicum]
MELLRGEANVSNPYRALQGLNRPGRRRDRRRKLRWRFVFLMLVGTASIVSTILSIVALMNTEDHTTNKLPAPEERTVHRIAFGSSTAYDYSPQPVWSHGIIPSDPDAWIWLGDMAYMDGPRVNCEAMPAHKHCNCTSDWLHQAPNSCMAGDVDHALSRVQAQLANPDYAQFLAFMCPGHRAKGLHPPTGPDPKICPRRIFGTYDDHDYSWEHGNKRLPHKDEIKQIFLDAVGEPTSSPRRNRGRGIEWKYTLNEFIKGKEVDIFLLDERYNRDTLPCHVRKSFCRDVVLPNLDHQEYAWCLDFLQGGELGTGSCCDKDDLIFYGWCLETTNKKNPLYAEACDPSSSRFGSRSLTVDAAGHLHEASGSAVIDGRAESPFCEVLGREQRLWLQDTLSQSEAPLKLIVSSSVVLGNPKPQMCGRASGGNVECICTGDDWECYKPAQLQLLHLLSEARGCVVVLTGDFHYSDIRVLRPDLQPYAPHYQSVNLNYPLFQVMASGLTTSTGTNFSCEAAADPVGLRDHPECNFVRGPSFGMVEVEWEDADPIVRLQIRDGNTGAVRLESNFTLSTCGAVSGGYKES